MSGRREHKRRYNQKLEFISRFEEWLAQEPPMFPCFWHWRKWRDNRPRFTSALQRISDEWEVSGCGK